MSTTTTLETASGPLSVATIDAREPWAGDETIIFHHGLGASSGIWRRWMPALADRYRLVTFDMRGHGATPAPANHAWSIDGMIDDLNAVVAHAGVDRFHLVGESIGGTLVLAYAARQAERLLSLTVSNGAHQGGSIENLAPWREIMASEGTAGWSRHMMQQRFYDGALSEAEAGWYEAQQAAADGATILAAAEMLAGADLTESLGNITVPTLLLHPDNSPFIPVTAMADLHARLPDSRLQVFAGTRHGLPFSHGRQCGAVLRSFLDDLSEGRG